MLNWGKSSINKPGSIFGDWITGLPPTIGTSDKRRPLVLTEQFQYLRRGRNRIRSSARFAPKFQAGKEGRMSDPQIGSEISTVDDGLGIVLIAHGSRRAEANEDLHRVAASMRQRGFPHVVAGFLELAEPDIHSAGDELVARGCRRIVLAPYFLSAGRHVVSDLEAARQELAAHWPSVHFSLAGPLGPHALLEQILLERIDQALGTSPH